MKPGTVIALFSIDHHNHLSPCSLTTSKSHVFRSMLLSDIEIFTALSSNASVISIGRLLSWFPLGTQSRFSSIHGLCSVHSRSSAAFIVFVLLTFSGKSRSIVTCSSYWKEGNYGKACWYANQRYVDSSVASTVSVIAYMSKCKGCKWIVLSACWSRTPHKNIRRTLTV